MEKQLSSDKNRRPNYQNKNGTKNYYEKNKFQGGSNRKNWSKNQHSNKKGNEQHNYTSSNMSYVFYTEYFDLLNDAKSVDDIKQLDFKSRTEALSHFTFEQESFPLKAWREIDNYQSITLKSTYPGLLIGTGNPHDLNGKSIIKAGFSFDYVTGLPFLPGSSLKGILKHHFPSNATDMMKVGYIQSVLPALDTEEVLELCKDIFENNDVFLGAFPLENQPTKRLLEMEYLTPHSKATKNPIPINLIKVRPGVSFEFAFLLKDSHLTSGKIVRVAEKREVFKMILTDMGIGAKTNTGFGQLEEV